MLLGQRIGKSDLDKGDGGISEEINTPDCL